jgi:hypothetical protein
VLILVYTFTQTLTYCCLAFKPLTIYEGSSEHEQKRLAIIPDIVWFGEDGEHKTMMAWSVACLLLWVVSTPLILCLFIFGGDRVMPAVLRGASGRFLKAHYRPGKQGFELVYMFRRIALTCAAILITNETGELAAINGILFLSGVLHFWQRPFKKWTHNYLEAASVMLLFFLYDTQVYLSAFVGPETEDAVTTLLDVVEVLGFALLFPFVVGDLGPMLGRCCRRKMGEQEKQESVDVCEMQGRRFEFSDRSLNVAATDEKTSNHDDMAGGRDIQEVDEQPGLSPSTSCCDSCGAAVFDPEAKFCGDCGSLANAHSLYTALVGWPGRGGAASMTKIGFLLMLCAAMMRGCGASLSQSKNASTTAADNVVGATSVVVGPRA